MSTVLLACVLAGCAVTARPPAPPDEAALPPPPPTSEGRDLAAENARCEGCHEDVAAEWRGSLHQRSWEDPVFLAAYSIEPLAFCRGCHAPEADPERPPDAAARAVGVGCVTCHTASLDVAGGPPLPAGAAAPHPIGADPALATTAACAGCHEFDFPRREGALMQGTLSEHRASPYSNTVCQSCHMKATSRARGAPGKSHRFGVLDEPEVLRAAVSAEAFPRTDRSIVVRLRAAEVGHAFPTGDMFRRLEVRARVQGAGGEPIRAPSVVLERVFRVHVGKNGITDRAEVRDDRVPASGAPRDVVVVFPEDVGGRAVRWEVAYRRMGPTLAASFGLDLEDDEVIVARGTLDVAPASGAQGAQWR